MSSYSRCFAAASACLLSCRTRSEIARLGPPVKRILPVPASRGRGCLNGCGAIPAMHIIFHSISGNSIDVVLKYRYAS